MNVNIPVCNDFYGCVYKILDMVCCHVAFKHLRKQYASKVLRFDVFLSSGNVVYVIAIEV